MKKNPERKMKNKIVALLALLLSSVGVDAQTHIPTSKIVCRDPFITVDREHGLYYLIKSKHGPDGARLFAYKSSNLEFWDEAGYVYHMPEGYKCPDDWWAPDTYFYNGKYYCFVTVSNQAKGIMRGTTVLRSDNGPLGPYRNIIPDDRIFITPPGMQCLDGSLYVDEQGTPWMFFSVEWNGPNVVDSVGEVWCQQLNAELDGTVGDPVKLFRTSDAPWAKEPSGKSIVTDAPFVWKDEKSGNLIMLWSSFTNVYSMGQAISQTGKPTGPWVHEKDAIFTDNGGHQMVFRDLKGNLKISFHSPNENPSILTICDLKIKNGKFLPIKIK